MVQIHTGFLNRASCRKGGRNEVGFLAQANILMEKMKLTNLNPESRVKQCHRMELKIQVFNSSRYPRTSKMHSHTEELRNYTGDICYGEIDTHTYIYIYIYIIVDSFLVAVVKPFKITNERVVEVKQYHFKKICKTTEF